MAIKTIYHIIEYPTQHNTSIQKHPFLQTVNHPPPAPPKENPPITSIPKPSIPPLSSPRSPLPPSKAKHKQQSSRNPLPPLPEYTCTHFCIKIISISCFLCTKGVRLSPGITDKNRQGGWDRRPAGRVGSTTVVCMYRFYLCQLGMYVIGASWV